MPLRPAISERRGALLAGAIVLIVVVIAALFSPDEEFDEWNISTYSSKSNGAKATYLLLHESGREVERWEQPPAALPEQAEGTLLLLVQPHRHPSEEDKKAIASFLERGGSVLASGYVVGAFLPLDRSRFHGPPMKAWRSYERIVPSAMNRRAVKITLPERQYWSRDMGELPAYGNESGAVVVTYKHGKGNVVWLASPVPLTNAGLTAEGNAEFLTDVLEGTGARRVLWDAYFGEQRQAGGWNIWSPALMGGAAQLLLVFTLVLWTYSRRSGPVRPAAAEPRLSPLEFVNTLGGLYRSAEATNVAVDVNLRRFQFRASRRLGLRSDVDTQPLADAVARSLRQQPEDVRAVLVECESARHDPSFPARRAVTLVRTLNGFLRDLRLIEVPTEEKR
jgi:hypothetical protein